MLAPFLLNIFIFNIFLTCTFIYSGHDMDLRNKKVKRKSCWHISYWPFLTMIPEGHQEVCKNNWNFPFIYLYILALVIAFKFKFFQLWVLVWCKIGAPRFFLSFIKLLITY
jgi:hypothetical protein